MTDLKTIDPYAARLLMLSFFLPQKWQVAVVMAVSLWFIFRSGSQPATFVKKDFAWALALSSLFIIYFAAILITPVEYRKILLHICERKVALFFTPFVMALAGPRYRRVIADELPYFVYGCIVSCVVGNADFIYHFLLQGAGAHQLSHVAYRILFEQVTGIHPTYMGMFLGFSLCVTLLSRGFGFRYARGVRYMLVFMLFLFLAALLAKSALIAMALIFAHYGWRNRKWVNQHKLRIAVMAAALAGMCFLIPFTRQRMQEVITFIGHGKTENITDNSVYVRKMIVDQDLSLLRGNWLAGVGPGRVFHALRERYFFYSLNQRENVSNYDPHNEYLNEWLGFGIAGIALLAFVLLIHIRSAVRTSNQLYLYLLIILCTTFFTETVLSRQEGILFYALFTSLFFFNGGRTNALAEPGEN